MKERPILFSGEMVRAILDGRKTQTRRVVNPQYPQWPDDADPVEMSATTIEGFQTIGHSGRWWDRVSNSMERRCPYGQPGDRLWVRETWRVPMDYDNVSPSKMHVIKREYVWYKTSASDKRIVFRPEGGLNNVWGGRWRPSIHMPRWASRINLLVKDVRVERVQDISEEDAIAEGIQKEDLVFDPEENVNPPGSYGYVSGLHPFPEGMIHVNAAEAFEELWDSINAKRGYGWHTNPWVWVIEFERITTND